jgi:hypothetical protein
MSVGIGQLSLPLPRPIVPKHRHQGGPFVRGRVIDVTPAAARALGFFSLTQVTLSAGE